MQRDLESGTIAGKQIFVVNYLRAEARRLFGELAIADIESDIPTTEEEKDVLTSLPSGTLITIFRILKRVPQNELAKKLGVSKPYMSRIESSKRPITKKIALAIIDAFGWGGERLASRITS